MPTVNAKKETDFYRQLSQADQSILQVLSVVYEPVNQTLLQEILRTLSWKDQQIITKSWREKMIRGNLLVQERGKFSCHLGLANALTVETVNKGTFDAILAAGLAKLPDRSQWGYDEFHIDDWRFKRRLRNALFKQDEKEFLKLLNIGDPYARPDEDRSKKLLVVFRP